MAIGVHELLAGELAQGVNPGERQDDVLLLARSDDVLGPAHHAGGASDDDRADAERTADLEHVGGADDVDGEAVDGPQIVLMRRQHRRHMDDALDLMRRGDVEHAREIGDRADLDREAVTVTGQDLVVGAGRRAVEDDNLLAFVEKHPCDVAADGPGSPGHEDAHFLLPGYDR